MSAAAIPISTNPISLGLKFKNLYENIKTHTSTDKKILSTLNKLKDVSVNSAQYAKQATQTTVVKTHNAILMMALKFPILIGIIAILTLYGATIIPAIYNLSLLLTNLFSNYLTVTGIAWITLIITSYFVINGLILILPFSTIENKLKFIFEKETMYVLLLITGIVIYSTLFSGTYQATENQQVMVQNSEKNIKSMIESITCSFDLACQQAKMQEQKADTTSRIDYSIKFTPPANIPITTLDMKYPVELFYEIQANDALKIEKVECYYNNKKPENLFSTKTFETPLYVSAAIPIFLEGIQCENLNSIPLEEKTIQDITIIPVLTLTLENDISFEIPMVNYNEFISALSPQREYSYQYLKEKLDEETKDINGKPQKSNNGLDVSASMLTSKLPLLIGDGLERDMTFVFTLEENLNNFGTFISGQITNINLPPGLKYKEGGENYKTEITFDNEKFQQNIQIMEDENVEFDGLKSKETLTIYTKSKFEKKDSFKIQVQLTQEEIDSIKAIRESKESKDKTTTKTAVTQTPTSNELLEKLGAPTNEIYEYGADILYSNLYYRYNLRNNMWEWSPNQEVWMDLYTEKVSDASSTYAGETPSSGNLEFIRQLRIENPKPNY